MNFLTHKPTATHDNYCRRSCDGWGCPFPTWVYLHPHDSHYLLGFYGDCWEYDYTCSITHSQALSLLEFLTTTHHQPATITAADLSLTYDSDGEFEIEHNDAGTSYLLDDEEVDSFIHLLRQTLTPSLP